MAVVNPIDYSSGSGFLQGLKAYGGMQDVQKARMDNEQAAAQQDALNAFKADWQSSFGDPEKMSALVAKYPGQMEAIKAGIGFKDEQHQIALGNAARDLRVAMATGSPQAIHNAAVKNAGILATVGASPEEVVQQFQQDPQALANTVDAVGLSALGPGDYYSVTGERDKLAEAIRSNKASEANTIRGQNISAQNARLSANGPTSAMQNYGEYSRLLKTDPEDAAIFAQAAGINTAGTSNRQVQLSDGRTVTVGGKLHGAGQNAFYEGRDDNGNVVRVPASAIAAPATSAASAGNYAMAKDLTAIENASPETLGFMTGVTGGNGSPAIGADVRSRISGKDERQVYNAAQRIQGKMQNQGIAAARDMGASGINTVAEAKMYFQGMPQIDFSSPDAVQESVRNIRQYTDQYNQQYNVNVGGRGGKQTAQPVAQPARQPQQSAGFSSLWGD